MILSKIVKPKYIVCDNKKTIFNASLFHKNNEDYLIARNSNYSAGNTFNGKYKFYEKHGFAYSNEILYRIDLNTGNASFVKNITNASERDKKLGILGYEDLRIINWYNKNYVFAVLYKRYSNTEVYKFELDDNFGLNNGIVKHTSNRIEKNWQPIEIMPNRVIYSYNPFIIFDYEKNNFIRLENKCFVNFRGSSQIIHVKENENIGIVHTRTNKPQYYHYFIMFDDNMKITKVSKPFSFIGVDVEFNCFIEKADDCLRILVGIIDSNCVLFEVPLNIVYNILNSKEDTDNSIDQKFLSEMYYKNNDTLSKICLATYSNDVNVLTDAIVLNHNSTEKIEHKIELQKYLINKVKTLT